MKPATSSVGTLGPVRRERPGEGRPAAPDRWWRSGGLLLVPGCGEHRLEELLHREGHGDVSLLRSGPDGRHELSRESDAEHNGRDAALWPPALWAPPTGRRFPRPAVLVEDLPGESLDGFGEHSAGPLASTGADHVAWVLPEFEGDPAH